MVREKGGDFVGALYRGFNLKLLRAVPASAVCFFAYEVRLGIEPRHLVNSSLIISLFHMGKIDRTTWIDTQPEYEEAKPLVEKLCAP